MLLRALIVLLLAMNLGVALWWAVRSPPVPEAAPAPPADVPRLKLLSEATSRDLDAVALNADNAGVQGDAPLEDAADRADDVAGAAQAGELRCFAIGPYAGAADMAGARAQLQPRVRRIRERASAVGARGWRVMMAPAADRGAAQAMVERLSAAGFDDHFIIAEGGEANAIALGRFGSEAGARRHEAALRGAGFEVAAEPLGATGSQAWLDVAAGGDFDPEAARIAAGAERAEPVDCARFAEAAEPPR